MTDLEIKLLQKQVEELTNKNRILNEVVLFYADPLVEWDKGNLARKSIRSINKGYKPLTNVNAVIFKEKEVYPFVEFGRPLDTEEYQDE